MIATLTKGTHNGERTLLWGINVCLVMLTYVKQTSAVGLRGSMIPHPLSDSLSDNVEVVLIAFA